MEKQYTPPRLGKYKTKMKGYTQKGSPSTVGTESVETSDKVEKAKIPATYTQKAVGEAQKAKGDSNVAGTFRSKKAQLKKIRAQYEAAKKSGADNAKDLASQYNNALKELKKYTATNVKGLVKSGKIERKYKGKVKRAMDKDDFLRGQEDGND